MSVRFGFAVMNAPNGESGVSCTVPRAARNRPLECTVPRWAERAREKSRYESCKCMDAKEIVPDQQNERRNSDRRCEAPKGGAIKQNERRNSDRRCEAPKGG